MVGSEHAALVMGAAKNKDIPDTTSYASWAFKADEQKLAGFLAGHSVEHFEDDYAKHGRPAVIELTGVNQSAVEKKWQWIQRKHKYYKLLGFNCATVVQRLVRHGMGLDERNSPDLVTPKGFWTPYDLQIWAESAKKGYS